MRIRILLSLLLLCFCWGPLTLLLPDSAGTRAAAQTTAERAKQRAERNANNRVDRKVDEGVDKAFDAIEGLFKKKNKKKNKAGTDSTRTTSPGAADDDYDQEAAAGMLSGLFGGNNDFEPFTNETSFGMAMEMTSTNRRGKEEVLLMEFGVAPTQIGQRITNIDGREDEGARTIFDTQTGNVTIVTKSKDGYQGVRTRMPGLSGLTAAMDPSEYLENITIETTSETRIIDGYNCRKYIVTDTEQDLVSETWLTQDVDLDSDALYRAISAMTGAGRVSAGPAPAPPVDGFPILTTQTDKKGRTTTIHYKDIRIGEANIDRSIFSLEGVEVMDMTGF